MSTITTPLTEWLRAATPEQRDRMATLAGTTVGYVYQLAGCSRGKAMTADLAFRMEDAMKTLHAESDGALPVVSARELSCMCALAGLTS
jgi:hypothetical protein